MSRLIVLSNRVKMPDNSPMAGGLAIALQDVLIGDSVVWMGWNGDTIDSSNDSGSFDDCAHSEFDTRVQAVHKKTIHKKAACKSNVDTTAEQQTADTTITYMTTALTTQQYQHFYCGFANNVLWPLLHEQTALISQAPDDYAGYQAVNRLFAQQLQKTVNPDDVIWVHDYHFLSVAYYCRQLGMSNRIGFFLHIPFVSLAYWQHLDKSPELIKHLAHYDVVGTQTQQGKANALAVFQHYLKASVANGSSLTTTTPLKHTFTTPTRSAAVQLTLSLESDDLHSVMINAYPIGVNVARIQQQAIKASSQAAPQDQKKSARQSDVQQIIAVDRIDYSKGLLKRFLAYRDFLQQYPAYQHQLKLLQIACPSRLDLPVYQQLYERVRQTVHEVNQQFSPHTCPQDSAQASAVKTLGCQCAELRHDWQAITYSEDVLSHEKLMTAFWQSDIGWINSLKDGMNLVAKEYIAAQNPDNPGVLVLSRYAGAAEQMQAAVIIDPNEPKSIIEGLKSALTMPLEDRKDRYQTLIQGLEQDDLHAWQQNFLDDLYDDRHLPTTRPSSAAIHLSDS